VTERETKPTPPLPAAAAICAALLVRHGLTVGMGLLGMLWALWWLEGGQ
jgi:hypothetical protein